MLVAAPQSGGTDVLVGQDRVAQGSRAAMPARRRRWIALLVLIALAFSAFLGLRALLKPERISAFLLPRIEAATGLQLSLQEPVDIGLWPDLHVELHGLSAREAGAATAFLEIARVELALPWSALRTDSDLHLRGIRLIAPRLDLPAILALLDARADDGPPPPLRIPILDAPLEIRDGRIIADGWSVERLLLHLPALREGTPSRLDASGSLQGEGAAQTFALQLNTTPRSEAGALRLDPFMLDLVADGLGGWRPHLEGWLRWHPAGLLDLALHGRIEPWPSDWPALPFPANGANGVELALAYSGAAALTGQISFALMRGEDGVRGTLTLNDTLAWLGGEHSTPLPPLDGEIGIPRLQHDGIEASGIRIRVTADDTE